MCDRILISLAHEMIRQLTYNELDREIHRQKKCIDKSCAESQGMDETVYLPHPPTNSDWHRRYVRYSD